MVIRLAKEKDIDEILKLLGQVLQIHADLRPDIFVADTTKYSRADIIRMIQDDSNPIYVAADEEDRCVGCAFCQIIEPSKCQNMVPIRQLFIDDLCVDESFRGKHIGEVLFDYVKNEAKTLGCYEVTLNVWEGNTSAEKFYEKMGMKVKEKRMEFIL
ncbi:MAG: GNAT family N-acetyltransferase [Lachnospiraceae bacterium]|nr:GNAT family N-acetyltransferase [Lachnospiraceae bacterium]